MPGPMSAPNGDKSIVADAQKRRELEKRGRLSTGKTSKKKNS